MKFRLEAVLALSNSERNKLFSSNATAKKYFTKDLQNPKVHSKVFTKGNSFNRHKDK